MNVIGMKDEIFARMGQLSPAEKKIARSLLADYPSVGLTSAATLAKKAGTSTPTVLRLVAHLGCYNYPDFQRRLLEEISNRANSPVTRASQGQADLTEADPFRTGLTQRIALVERLSASVPPSEFDESVRLLAGKPRNVITSGGYFSQQIARLLAFQLDQIIPNVQHAEDPLGHDIGQYLSLRDDSVVIIFDTRRYELSAKQLAAIVKKQGAKLIVITDEELSPSAEYADTVLPVPVDGLPFDSHAALLVLVECLVDAVFRKVGEKGLERMGQWENTVQIHRAFRASTKPSDSSTALTNQSSHDRAQEKVSPLPKRARR